MDVELAAGFVPRHLAGPVAAALEDTPVVVINGPRQAGKTTLAAGLLSGGRGTYLSLDEPDVRAAARDDPAALLGGRAEPVVLDEFQREPDLLLAVKASVDSDRRPGRFVLTGSSRYLTLPRVSESLAGRVEVLELLPFSQGELEGAAERFLARLFRPSPWTRPPTLDRRDYLRRICAGGFPEALRRPAGRRRERWFDSYVQTVTRRDVTEIADVRRIDELSTLLQLVAARSASVLSVADLARDAALKWETANTYLALLEAVYLVHRVPAWTSSATTRLTKQPKVVIGDSGLAAHLLGVDTDGLMAPGSPLVGPLLEGFVVAELIKQRTWSDVDVRLSHFRDRDRHEVDVVLETRDGRVAAVEVKAVTRIRGEHLHGLRRLMDVAGERFVQGVLLYTGGEVVQLDDRLHAVPLSALWQPG